MPANIKKVPFGKPQIERKLGIILPKNSTKNSIISALHAELCNLCGYTPAGLGDSPL